MNARITVKQNGLVICDLEVWQLFLAYALNKRITLPVEIYVDGILQSIPEGDLC